MSVASESLEHAEHAAHGAHAGGPGKGIGLTMAMLGVLLAFCAAEVGAERTELTKSMVEQTQISAESQANQMKYRLVMLELEKSRAAITPAGEGPSEGAPVAAPDPVRARTLDRLLQLVVQYIDWKEGAKAWVKTYDPLIAAHAESAEGFERAQLAAEVGIVLASIALLLSNKRVWAISIVLAVLSLGMVGRTWQRSHHELEEGEHNVEVAKEKYAQLRKVQDPNADDQRTLEMLDPGGKRRAAVTAAYAQKAGEHADEHKGGGHGEHADEHH